MARVFTPKVLTANDLLLGDVIYWDHANRWTRVHSEAYLFTDKAEADAALVKALEDVNRIVGPYLADAKAGPDGPEPVHFREAFRTRGPSNYAHGKQVESQHV